MGTSAVGFNDELAILHIEAEWPSRIRLGSVYSPANARACGAAALRGGCVARIAEPQRGDIGTSASQKAMRKQAAKKSRVDPALAARINATGSQLT